MKKLIRPPSMEDGEYFIGKFLINVIGGIIEVSTRQSWDHRHQDIDGIILCRFDKRFCRIKLQHEKDSNKAEVRISRLLLSKDWKARPFKVK